MTKNLLEEISWICNIQDSIRMEGEAETTAETTTTEVIPPKEETTTTAETTVETTTETPPAPPKWATERIDELTRMRREAERRATVLETELALLRAGKSTSTETETTTTSGSRFTEDEINTRAREVAKGMLQEESFSRDLDKVWSEGVAKYPDFQQNLNTLKGALEGVPRQFMEAALETGKAADLLQLVATDLNLARELFSLPPMRLAVRLSNMAANPPHKKTSEAPRPPGTRVEGTGEADLTGLNDTISMEEFARRRVKNAPWARQRGN